MARPIMRTTSPTQQDIARLCNVSRSTVAAIIRNDERSELFHPETRERVLAAMRECGYHPHSAGSSLRSGRTHTVALAIPHISVVSHTIASRILHGIGAQAQSLGYALTLCSYSEKENLHSSFDRLLRQSRFDGVFFYADQRAAVDPREAVLRDLGLPYVALERESSVSPALTFDNEAGAREAVAHLIDHGRRRIAFVGVGDDQITPQRRAGYAAAIRAAGIAEDPKLICKIEGFEADNGGRSAIQGLIRNGRTVDAIFCVSDMIAMAAIQELAICGIRVPEDVAVIGFGDEQMAAMSTPPLTSVYQDGVELGRRAMNMLHDRILGKPIRPDLRVIPLRLVRRCSCGCPSGIEPTGCSRPKDG